MKKCSEFQTVGLQVRYNIPISRIISSLHLYLVSKTHFSPREFLSPPGIILISWNMLFEKIEEGKEASRRDNTSRTYAYTDGR